MKRILYYICIPIIVVIGIPFMFIDRDRWNRFGRSIDKIFGVESRHTKNYKQGKHKENE